MTVDMGWDTERLQGFPCNNLYSKLKSSSKFQLICSLAVSLFHFLCICIFVSLSVFLPVSRSVCLFLLVCLSVCLFVCLFVCFID